MDLIFEDILKGSCKVTFRGDGVDELYCSAAVFISEVCKFRHTKISILIGVVTWLVGESVLDTVHELSAHGAFLYEVLLGVVRDTALVWCWAVGPTVASGSIDTIVGGGTIVDFQIVVSEGVWSDLEVFESLVDLTHFFMSTFGIGVLAVIEFT